jgi:hypothetical protein
MAVNIRGNHCHRHLGTEKGQGWSTEKLIRSRLLSIDKSISW